MFLYMDFLIFEMDINKRFTSKDSSRKHIPIDPNIMMTTFIETKNGRSQLRKRGR